MNTDEQVHGGPTFLPAVGTCEQGCQAMHTCTLQFSAVIAAFCTCGDAGCVQCRMLRGLGNVLLFVLEFRGDLGSAELK